MTPHTQSKEIHNLTKHLKEVCFEMRLLLVEDDKEVRDQMQKFLSKFFYAIDTAQNGEEAFFKYKNKKYALIITDLTMPVMNGLELTKKIKQRDPTQSILILSAYFESETLLQLINTGIDGFLIKPVDIRNTLIQLTKTADIIYNNTLLKYYSETLEETNEELAKSNLELQEALESLQANLSESRQKTEYKDRCELPKSSKMSAVDFFNAYPFELEKTNEDLESLEDEFNLALIRSENNIQKEVLERFIEIVNSYAHTVEMIPQFGALSYGIRQLGETFAQINDPSQLQSVLPMLAHLFDNLEEWRKAVFYRCDAEDIHYMDNSLISDAQSLQGILSDTNDTSSAADDIELF